jgi:hypothetical protein
MTTPICLVFRSGGSFGPEHVNWLTKQIRRYHGFNPIYLLTDVNDAGLYHHIDVGIPLIHGWKGWWAKMELFDNTSVLARAEDIFYMDLDTVVTGPLTDLLDTGRTTALQGFKRKEGINSSVMLLTKAARTQIWERWQQSPDLWMERYAVKGDQRFLGDHFGPRFKRWQTTHPEAILSYEVDLKKGQYQPPAQTSIVAFHGPPRPWDVNLPWVPKLRKDIA